MNSKKYFEQFPDFAYNDISHVCIPNICRKSKVHEIDINISTYLFINFSHYSFTYFALCSIQEIAAQKCKSSDYKHDKAAIIKEAIFFIICPIKFKKLNLFSG